MLKKLMNYDLKSINKYMFIYFIITFIVCIMTRTMSYFNDSFIENILYMILRSIVIACFSSCLVNSIMRIWVRFRNNTYKDESYLTHTLPVSKNTLYNTKVLSAIVSILITLIIVVLCFLIVFLDNTMIDNIKNIFSNKDTIFIFINLILIALLEMIYMVYSGIIGILLGHKSNNHRDIKSVFLGIVLYFTIQLVILGIVYVIGLLNTDISNLFSNTNNINQELPSVKLLTIMVNSVYLIFTITMYFIGKKLFNKGINVD